MGTIAELFESEERKNDKGLFNVLVMLARVDGKIDDNELKLLTKIARRLSLTSEQVEEIISHPDRYPITPPISKEERYERFLSLVEMVVADGAIDDKEMKLIDKYGVSMGLDDEEIKKLFEKASNMFAEGKTKGEILDVLLD